MALLADLCSGVPQLPRLPGAGRPRLPLSDMVFASVYKVYVGFSSRRFTSDLRGAFADGLVNSTPHFNSVSNHMAKPELTDTLKNLVAASSLPLKPVETSFAVDSSGFSTSTSFAGTTKSMDGRRTTGSVSSYISCAARSRQHSPLRRAGLASRRRRADVRGHHAGDRDRLLEVPCEQHSARRALRGPRDYYWNRWKERNSFKRGYADGTRPRRARTPQELITHPG